MSPVSPILLLEQGIKRSLRPSTSRAVPRRGYRQSLEAAAGSKFLLEPINLEKLLTQRMNMSSKTEYQELEALARKGRWLAISTVAGSGAGHVGGPFSALDIMVALYFRVMK